LSVIEIFRQLPVYGVKKQTGQCLHVKDSRKLSVALRETLRNHLVHDPETRLSNLNSSCNSGTVKLARAIDNKCATVGVRTAGPSAKTMKESLLPCAIAARAQLETVL
jgi:hypothetical protein